MSDHMVNPFKSTDFIVRNEADRGEKRETNNSQKRRTHLHMRSLCNRVMEVQLKVRDTFSAI